MRIERVAKMGEHQRNPMAIYFKKNPWAPDFRPHLGKRRPHGKGIRSVYKILMESSDEAGFHNDKYPKNETSLVMYKEKKRGKRIKRYKVVKKYENIAKTLRGMFHSLKELLSSFRTRYLGLANIDKNV